MTITKELCQKLAHYVYGGDILEGYLNTYLPQYKRAEVGLITNDKGYFKDITTGCAAAFYYNETLNEGVIAYRGTERPGLGELGSISLPDLKDWKADASLMMNKVPDQFNSAKYFYEQVKKAYPDTTLGFTGHSLGGALASLVAVKAGSYPTFTFNAPGVRHLLNNPSIGLPLNGNYNAITNFSVMNDWCGMVHTHIGKLYVFPPQPMKKLLSSNDFAGMAPFIDTHEWILGANLNKAVSKPTGFNESEGLSLWCYDANNYVNNKVTDSTLRPLVQEIIARISVQSLENALKILRNNPNLIEHDFTYKAGGKTYYLPKANGKTITGTTNAEVLFGSSNDDILQGNSGNDELHGFEGDDTLKGGSGNDTIYAGEGNSIVYGDAGNDVLYTGSSGNCTLYGGSGNDVLVARPMPYAELKKKWKLGKK